MATTPYIQFKQVTKSYRSRIALYNVSMALPRQKIIGLVGPNGSGKSTLLKLMAGLARPSFGLVLIDDRPVRRIDAGRVAYMPETDPLYPFMTVKESMDFQASQFVDWNPAKADCLLELMELDLRWRIGQLSHGQRERLKLILTLARDADLIMLDDVLAPLDVLLREQMIKGILQCVDLSQQTLVLATHQISEVETLLDLVVLVSSGRVAAIEDAETIRSQAGLSLVDWVKANLRNQFA